MAEEKAFITLISSDDHRFILPRSAALGSGFIKNTLASGFGEALTGVIRLSDQSAEIVGKVVEYLMYKEHYQNSRDDAPDFQERVNSNMALELCAFLLLLPLTGSL
ncbi:hypothetical protein RQP46_001353 [Phenoliferia psychrophenolica]